jgi:hypothetical protein
MIKFNTPYTIENGDTVVFTEGKKGTINGTYTDATLTGSFDGEVLKATFHNKKVSAIGLMEIIFHEDGFDAKWKSGLEPGPMRGKWEGRIENLNELKSEKLEVLFDFELAIKNGMYSFVNGLKKFESQLTEYDEEMQSKIAEDFITKFNNYIFEKQNFHHAYFGKISSYILDNSEVFPTFFLFENEELLSERFGFSIEDISEDKFLNLVVDRNKLSIDEINSDYDIFIKFNDLVCCSFCFTIDSVIEENDAELLAEFIFSISGSNSNGVEDEDNAISDSILDLIKFSFGIDIHDEKYSGGCSIIPYLYIDNEVESGYDYINLSQDLIDSNI